MLQFYKCNISKD